MPQKAKVPARSRPSRHWDVNNPAESARIAARGGADAPFYPWNKATGRAMQQVVKRQQAARAVRRVDEALRAAAAAPAADVSRAAPDVRLGMAPPSAGRGVRRARGGS